MEALQDDTGDCSMQCTEHPFKNDTPAGGICAICLQEKLGKLVSSSFPIAVFPSSSSSSSPSFRSDINSINTTITTTNNNTTTVVNTAVVPPRLLNSNTQITSTNTTTTNCQHYQYHSNRSRILYLIGQKKKKKKDQNIPITGQTSHDRNNIVYKRSKSTADGLRDMNADNTSPHKRWFWSFIHSQKPSHSTSSSKTKTLTNISSNTLSASTRSQRDNGNEITIVENNESPCHHASFDRKVSRSRSVGCGSRSFSGDFFERISTGFGDCTLRRVESHRERKSHSQVSVVRNNGQDCIKERVRCGGLFSGFMITSSSSSSASSSHWVVSNSNTKETNNDNASTGKVTSAVSGKERSWGWALASPIRAFSKPASSKREGANKNVTPNLGAIPSLLSVRS